MGAYLTLTGRLGKDPETRTSQKGNTFVKLSIAHNDKSRDGQDSTMWFDVVVFGQRANFASQYLHKGDLVQVIGPLKFEMYQGRDGQMRISASVTADQLESLGGGKASSGTDFEQRTQQQPFHAEPQVGPDMDDFPF